MAASTKDEHLPGVVMPAVGIERILTGQKALITGANSGIGRGIALALGKAGQMWWSTTIPATKLPRR